MKSNPVRSLLVFGARFTSSEMRVDKNGENVTFTSYEDAIRILQAGKAPFDGAWEIGFVYNNSTLYPQHKTISELLGAKRIPWHSSDITAKAAFDCTEVTVEGFKQSHSFGIQMQF